MAVSTLASPWGPVSELMNWFSIILQPPFSEHREERLHLHGLGGGGVSKKRGFLWAGPRWALAASLLPSPVGHSWRIPMSCLHQQSLFLQEALFHLMQKYFQTQSWERSLLFFFFLQKNSAEFIHTDTSSQTNLDLQVFLESFRCDVCIPLQKGEENANSL